MRPTIQPMKTDNAGGIFSIDFPALTVLKSIYILITADFKSGASGDKVDYFTDWGSLNVGHIGAVSEGDFISVSSLGLLHRINQMGKGGLSETNTGVASSKFRAFLKIPFDLGSFFYGNPNNNAIPMNSMDKFQFRLPTYGGSAAATDLENISFEIGVIHGGGSFRYLPVLSDDSVSSSSAQFESIPNDLLMLMVPKPAAGDTTLRVAVKEGTNNALDSTLWSILNDNAASEFNITESAAWDMAAVSFWNGQDLSSALGKNLRINLTSGSGTVFWGSYQQKDSDYFNKLSENSNAIITSQQISELSSGGTSNAQLENAMPALAVEKMVGGSSALIPRVIKNNARVVKRTRKSLIGLLFRGRT